MDSRPSPTQGPAAGLGGKPTFAGACGCADSGCSATVGEFVWYARRMDITPPPSDSLQASDFNHSRASFFSPSVS